MSYVSEDLAEDFREDIQRKIRIQEQYLGHLIDKRQMTEVRVYILSLPHNGFKWPRVCVDEAESLRNQLSSNARIIRLLEAKALYMMTATPALNKIDNVKSFASLAMTYSNLDIKIPSICSWEYIAEIYQPYGEYVAPQRRRRQ